MAKRALPMSSSGTCPHKPRTSARGTAQSVSSTRRPRLAINILTIAVRDTSVKRKCHLGKVIFGLVACFLKTSMSRTDLFKVPFALV